MKNKTIYKISRYLLILSTIITFWSIHVNANPFIATESNTTTHEVKYCFFHETIYEVLFSFATECSFNINNPPMIELDYPAHSRHLAHDPECFGVFYQP